MIVDTWVFTQKQLDMCAVMFCRGRGELNITFGTAWRENNGEQMLFGGLCRKHHLELKNGISPTFSRIRLMQVQN